MVCGVGILVIVYRILLHSKSLLDCSPKRNRIVFLQRQNILFCRKCRGQEVGCGLRRKRGHCFPRRLVQYKFQSKHFLKFLLIFLHGRKPLEKLAADGTIAKLAEKYGLSDAVITDFADQKK